MYFGRIKSHSNNRKYPDEYIDNLHIVLSMLFIRSIGVPTYK